MVKLIVASTAQGVIGKDGDLPWRYPEDLRWFKAKTMGGVLIVGRKTFETLPKSMPGREIIVVSRNPEYSAPCVAFSVAGAIEAAQNLFPGKEIWIGGGGEIYRSALSSGAVDQIHITEVPDLIPPGHSVVFWPHEVLGQDFDLQSSNDNPQNPVLKHQLWCKSSA